MTNEQAAAAAAKAGQEAPFHIILALDKSGSMYKLSDDVLRGVDAFVDEQRRMSSPCDVTVLSFDSEPHELLRRTSLPDVPAARSLRFQCYGGTHINSTLTYIASITDVPTNTLVCILTDGEIAEPIYAKEQIAKQVAAGAQFFFIGLGTDQHSASVLGFKPENYCIVGSEPDDAKTALALFSRHALMVRCGA